MAEIKLKINGVDVIANEGDTVLKAARENGIEIPTLCQSDIVKVYGACGLCTCLLYTSPSPRD